MGDQVRIEQREASELLDREWDPIGVYQRAGDEQASPGEYDTYAGWIVNALRTGGGSPRFSGSGSQRVNPWGSARRHVSTIGQRTNCSDGGSNERPNTPRCARLSRRTHMLHQHSDIL
jgi:hypothetical protein